MRLVKSEDRGTFRRHLEKLCAALWDGTTPDALLADSRSVFFEVWPSALIVIQTVEHPAGLELCVVGVVGSGVVSQIEEIANDLRTMRDALGCRWIGGNVIRPGLARLYDQLGAREVSRYYLMESPDGRQK